MDDFSLLPGIGQGGDDFAGNVDDFVHRQRAIFLQQFLQGGAIDELHGKVVQSLVGVDCIGLDDVRVVDAGGGPGFIDETLDEGDVLSESRQEDFERDVAIQADLASQINCAHAANADFADDGKVAENSPRRSRRWRDGDGRAAVAAGDQLAGLSVDVKNALTLVALETHGSVLTVDDGTLGIRRPGRKKRFFRRFRV